MEGLPWWSRWLRLHAVNARSPGLIPGQGTTNRSHMPQLRVRMLQLKILHAATKTWYSQINKYLKRENGWNGTSRLRCSAA